jgi:hypothetical protein
MQTLTDTLLTLGIQLAVAALAGAVSMRFVPRGRRCGTAGWRRRRAVWLRAATTWVQALPLAVVLGLSGGALLLVSGLAAGGVARWSLPVLPCLLGTPPTAGALLVAQAAYEEAGGGLRRARRQVRPGGLLLCAGNSLLLCATALLWLGSPAALPGLGGASVPSGKLVAAGTLALAGAAGAGLLAALSRKPRPTGVFAVLLHLIGLACLLGTIWSPAARLGAGRVGQPRPSIAADPARAILCCAEGPLARGGPK